MRYLEDHLEDGCVVVPPKRRQPAQQDVQDDAQGPVVGLVGVFATQDLGRHVVRGAHQLLEELAFLEERGQAKVSGLDVRDIACGGNVGPKTNLLGSWLVGWMVGRLAGCLLACLLASLVGCLVNRLIDG